MTAYAENHKESTKKKSVSNTWQSICLTQKSHEKYIAMLFGNRLITELLSSADKGRPPGREQN